MKNLIRLILALMTITHISCEKDDLEYRDEYENSYQAWLDFKQESNNSYMYTTSTSSWVGFSVQTTITVEDGVVVGRYFRYSFIGGVKMPEEGWDEESAISAFRSIGYSDIDIERLGEEEGLLAHLQWIENKDEIGMHGDYGIWTLDEVYAMAKNTWLIKRDNAKTYFETDNDGLISACSYVENGCQDDCAIGIHIDSIRKIEK